MNWIKFTLWLSGIYAIYYMTLIAWDALRRRRSAEGNELPQLTFIEHHEPAAKELESEASAFPSAVLSSGGVSLKQLFGLAREEAIEYTRAVSF